MSNMGCVSYKRYDGCLDSPSVFGGVRVAHRFVFCFVFLCFACFRPVSCAYPMLQVSLD